MAHMDNVVNALQQTPATNQRLRRSDFDLGAASPNQRSRIARYEAESPIAFRDAPLRLAFTVAEQFTTNATAGDTETFNLSNDAIQTRNTTNFILYEGSSQVAPDAVNYSGDSFDYTDDGTSNVITAFYVARDPVSVEVEKVAPKAQGSVTDGVYDDVTTTLNERDQNREPPEWDFNTALEPVVPRKWYVDVYAKGDPALALTDENKNSPQGVTAVNAVISLPIRRAQQDVPNLGKAVKMDILG